MGFQAATVENVAPAAAFVPAPANKDGAPYFDWENLQLTAPVLANLTELDLSDIGAFAFPSTKSPSVSQCKVFPGDADWPSPLAWNVLNLLSGGALIKTIPLAASCYKDWQEYNETECEYITNNWSDPHLQ